ncbi:pseudouridine synthase [Clostridium sp.]|uniref:pseudouridine synthase n=1 Tax=Clostridium sp. TaxID=1506 RepID=UPI002633068F|nr:pseudouridine synthase [Clostridium sp.]
MRINKLLSNYGYCSRREVNRVIEEGRIIINGKVAEKGQWVEENDKILLDGVPVVKKEKIYILLNKPRGIICTASKEKENNIIDFLNFSEYVFPVGSLDKDSQGLIILTNDGDLANIILSSDNYHEKEYEVTLDREYDEEFLNRMSKGVEILGIKTRPCKLEKVSEITFRIILTQGLNRQIRRMCNALKYNVVKLDRIRIVNLSKKTLKIGGFRHINEDELLILSEKVN